MLPFMELEDGTILPESNAIRHCAAQAAGMLGEGKDFALSEMLLGFCQDLQKEMFVCCPTMMTVGSWTAEKTKQVEEEVRPKVLAKLQQIAQFCKDGKFTSKTTLGEVQLWFQLYQCVDGPHPQVVEQAGLKPFYDRMLAEPGVKKLLDGSGTCGSLPNYVVPLP